VRPAPHAGPTIEPRLAELEQRSTQLVESVLKTLRGQVEELARKSLEEFHQKAESIIQDAEGRMRDGLQQAYEDSAASLMDLRTNLMDQLASRGAQLIRSTEDSMRTRLRSQSAVENRTAPEEPPEQPLNK
jgi:vacuolar-type H+-ATPase subunit H